MCYFEKALNIHPPLVVSVAVLIINIHKSLPVTLGRERQQGRQKHNCFNPRTYNAGGGWMSPPHKVFLSFFLEDKTSAPDVFSSSSLIPCADFETSSMVVSGYGYEI